MFGHKVFYRAFNNVKLDEYIKLTFDKPIYFLNSKKDFLPSDTRRYLAFASTRQFSSMMQKFGLGNNVDEFFYILNKVKERMKAKNYKFNKNKYAYIEENISSNVKAKADNIAERISKYLTGYFDEIEKQTNKSYSDIFNHQQREELLVKSVLAYYSIDNSLHNYVSYKYDFFDYENKYFEIEDKLKLNKAFSSPAVWTGIMALEGAYNTFSSLDDLLRQETFSNLTTNFKSKLANKTLDDITSTYSYFELIQKEFEKQFNQGEIVLTIAGEVGSTIATQYAVSILARSSLFIASLLPQARILNIAKTGLEGLAIFMQRSFVSNFFFQTNIEWELDGYIQEVLRPYVKKLFNTEIFEEEQKAKLRLYYNLSIHFIQCEAGLKASCSTLDKLGYTRDKLLNELTEAFNTETAKKFMANIDLAYLRYKYLKDLLNAKIEAKKSLNKLLTDLKDEVLNKSTEELYLDNKVVLDKISKIVPASLNIGELNAKIENYKKLAKIAIRQDYDKDYAFQGFSIARQHSTNCYVGIINTKQYSAYESVDNTNSYFQFNKVHLYNTNESYSGIVDISLYQDKYTFSFYYFHATPFSDVNSSRPNSKIDTTYFYINKNNIDSLDVRNNELIRFNTKYKTLAKALFSFVPIKNILLTPELIVIKFYNNIKKYVYLDISKLDYIEKFEMDNYKSYTLIDAKTYINLHFNKTNSLRYQHYDEVINVINDSDGAGLTKNTLCLNRVDYANLYNYKSISSSLSKSKNVALYINIYDDYISIGLYRSHSLYNTLIKSECSDCYSYLSENLHLYESFVFTYQNDKLVNQSESVSYSIYRVNPDTNDSVMSSDVDTFYKELRYDRY